MDEGGATTVFFDPTNLEEMLTFAGSPAVATRLVNRFLASARRDCSALDEALAGGDLNAVAFVAHRCKGAALNVGAIALGAACSEANDAARADDWAAAQTQVDLAKAAFGPTVEAMRKWARKRLGTDIEV